ncbi:MAG: chorismate synthase [Planctomycetales bacterium]|nr:MAG: chorismate synthase [Planctomycetales bacterium]
MALRHMTAGDSHGPGLLGILEGMPAGLELSEELLLPQLQRRQAGYGSGGRMKIEKDRARIMAGVYEGRSTGAPIGLLIENLDFANWQNHQPPLYTVPRPGHADLAGAVKYGLDQTRPISERASARETAMRVAIGAIARLLLEQAGICVYSRVVQIGGVRAEGRPAEELLDEAEISRINEACEQSEVRVADSASEAAMLAAIDNARESGDSLGGSVELFACNPPIGLGTHVAWDRRLDTKLAAALMSVPAVKSVEIGIGSDVSVRPGSAVHDQVDADNPSHGARLTNRAGGIEGGMTNGMPVWLRVHFKPIATLQKTLNSVDLHTGESRRARYQRSDVCIVPRGCSVLEAELAITMADALLDSFGQDRLDQLLQRLAAHRARSIREHSGHA